jgi:hypothetical protein
MLYSIYWPEYKKVLVGDVVFSIALETAMGISRNHQTLIEVKDDTGKVITTFKNGEWLE